MTDPDDIRRDIEGTQRELGADVDALNERINPGRVVQRGMAGVRHTVAGTRDSATGRASNTAATASSAPETARRWAHDNPLAAGLAAFGAGWLLSAVLPATRRERDAVGRAEDVAREYTQPVGEQLGQVTEQVRDNLREPAQQAAESMRSTAGDAASRVREEARSAGAGVTARAQEARDTVRDRGA
jgi:ElaB/YqjD/DUF883 family membrane-anchored ribosome-binding protein